MDILGFLKSRLLFIQRFYSTAAEPFETTKRKIESGEEPYQPQVAPEDYDGPEYEIEWQEADNSLRVLGHCSLGLVQKALQDYLRAFIMREAGVAQPDELGRILADYRSQNQGWFERYCAYLEQRTQFSWAASPVAKDRIEQINLSRIDVTHDPDIDSTWPKQSKEHFQKYPRSRFADDLELASLTPEDGLPEFPTTINVTRDGLMTAIEDVRQFCAYVEAQRTRW